MRALPNLLRKRDQLCYLDFLLRQGFWNILSAALKRVPDAKIYRVRSKPYLFGAPSTRAPGYLRVQILSGSSRAHQIQRVRVRGLDLLSREVRPHL